MKNNLSKFKFVLVVMIAVLAPFVLARVISFVQSNTIEESIPSVVNVDTNQNNQYQIEGRVDGVLNGASPSDIFINLYQQKKFRIMGIVFRRWSFISTRPVSNNLSFRFTNAGAGTYRLVPLSNQSLDIYFIKSYQIAVNRHNPKSISIDAPLPSRWDYLWALLLTKVGH